MKKIRTHYDNLQVSEKASLDAIKGAYKYLSQRWHPDRNPDQREKAERISKILNDAYWVLSDPERRKKHDEWIREQGVQEDGGKEYVYEDSCIKINKQDLVLREALGGHDVVIPWTKIRWIEFGVGKDAQKIVLFSVALLFWLVMLLTSWMNWRYFMVPWVHVLVTAVFVFFLVVVSVDLLRSLRIPDGQGWFGLKCSKHKLEADVVASKSGWNFNRFLKGGSVYYLPWVSAAESGRCIVSHNFARRKSRIPVMLWTMLLTAITLFNVNSLVATTDIDRVVSGVGGNACSLGCRQYADVSLAFQESCESFCACVESSVREELSQNKALTRELLRISSPSVRFERLSEDLTFDFIRC